jgi:HK97 gp10 family phage protein
MADLENIAGLRELQQSLTQLPANIAKNVLRGAVNAGASVIRKDAQARAPVDTGMLKRALYQKQIRELSSAVQQTFFVGVRQGRSAKKTKKGVINAWYAKFIEFGTSKMAARPFMRPAFEAKKQESVTAIKDYLEKRIPEEVEKARKK